MSQRVDDFDFDLPEELIALRPVSPRRAARMLVWPEESGESGASGAAGRTGDSGDSGGEIVDSTAASLPDWLAPGDLLVLNDTRVIPARLSGVRRRADGAEARVEATLTRRVAPNAWACLAKPGKRLRIGDMIAFDADLRAVVAAKHPDGAAELTFSETGPALDAAIAAAGAMPLPPYIAARRPADAADRSDYQTVFARRDGAVAAPTASLHFDDALLRALDQRGVKRTHVTLHVGAGTFLPVKSDTVSGHKMHAEWGEVSEQAAADIAAAKAAGGRVVPVGTTALRLIETAARGAGVVVPWRGDTDIFIRPGFAFQAADALMTNFHLPRSTLMMLVAAFIGMEPMRAVYAHAVAQGYRFYSYGDASLLFRPRKKMFFNVSKL